MVRARVRPNTITDDIDQLKLFEPDVYDFADLDNVLTVKLPHMSHNLLQVELLLSETTVYHSRVVYGVAAGMIRFGGMFCTLFVLFGLLFVPAAECEFKSLLVTRMFHAIGGQSKAAGRDAAFKPKKMSINSCDAFTFWVMHMIELNSCGIFTCFDFDYDVEKFNARA